MVDKKQIEHRFHELLNKLTDKEHSDYCSNWRDEYLIEFVSSKWSSNTIKEEIDRLLKIINNRV